MGVQTHPIPHPLSSRMRGPIPLPPLKCHSERSTAESRKLAAITPIPHPLSSRMREPISLTLPTCHSERSAAEPRNLVAIPPSPAPLPSYGRYANRPFPTDVIPLPTSRPSLPLRSGGRPPAVLASRSCPREDGGRGPIPPFPHVIPNTAQRSRGIWLPSHPHPRTCPLVGAVRESPVPQPLITPTPSALDG